MEVNRQLPFLDVLVSVNNANNFDLTVFRKPMAANRIIPFNSEHYHGNKTAVLHCLVKRAFETCTDDALLKCELGRINSVCEAGGYPRRLLKNVVSNYKRKKLNSDNPSVDYELGAKNSEIIRWRVTYCIVTYLNSLKDCCLALAYKSLLQITIIQVSNLNPLKTQPHWNALRA